MMKKKSGFTLAEVLTTLMVIGVVAAMTIPTLMNSTDDQQAKVATKKAMSVLSQGIQMLTAKEDECYSNFSVEGRDSSAALAACMANIMSGTLNDNEITTPDGMVYKFFADTTNDNTTLEGVCGSNLSGDQAGWTGQGYCGVVVDINGKAKGARDFGKTTFDSNGFSNLDETRDRVAFTLSANGVRPAFVTSGDNKAYKYMYGDNTLGSGQSNPWTDNGSKTCYKCEGTTLKTQTIAKDATCNSAEGWQTSKPTCEAQSN